MKRGFLQIQHPHFAGEEREAQREKLGKGW